MKLMSAAPVERAAAKRITCSGSELTEGPDARIGWNDDALRAEAKLDGGKAAEVVLTRFPARAVKVRLSSRT